MVTDSIITPNIDITGIINDIATPISHIYSIIISITSSILSILTSGTTNRGKLSASYPHPFLLRQITQEYIP